MVRLVAPNEPPVLFITRHFMWITPTADTLKARISGPEFEALKSAARAAGQNADTMVADCLSRIVALIRGYCGGRHVLGAEGTIPDELESALGALFVVEFITRLPGMTKLLDANRTKAKEDSLQLLRDVAAARFAIVPPVTPAPDASQSGGPGITLASSSTRQATRNHLDGLL